MYYPFLPLSMAFAIHPVVANTPYAVGILAFEGVHGYTYIDAYAGIPAVAGTIDVAISVFSVARVPAVDGPTTVMRVLVVLASLLLSASLSSCRF
jgi:arginine/ornithine N-succinyltransferase beta subunit